MSANETSATIMASSLGVVVGDRGTDTTTRRLGGHHRLRGDPVGSLGAPLGWRGTWAARAQIGSGGGATFLSLETAAPPPGGIRFRLTGRRAISVPSGAGSGGAWRSLTATRVTMTCAHSSIGAGPHEW
jgi:hypothetical protein